MSQDLPARLRMRRFSEGLERAVLDRMRLHVGRFSEGVEQRPEPAADPEATGRFSRGQDHLRSTDTEATRVGRFDDVDRPRAV
jgi:hypothetical protein